MHASSLKPDIAPESDRLQKVLIVDDLEQNLISLKKVLKNLSVEVLTASSGNEGLTILLQQQVSLAIIDVQMPGMDGFEMARLMQELEETRHIPIIFVTAISKERAYVYKGYLAGAVDYLFVPIDPDILLCKLSIFLNIERRQNQLEQALLNLRRITNQYQKVLDSVNDGILGLKPSGIITFANPAAGRLLGCKSAELIGQHFMSLMSPPGSGDAQSAWKMSPLRKLFQKEQGVRFLDSHFWRRDGTRFPVEYSCSAMRIEQQDESGHVLVFQDVTERKLAEEKLLKLANYDSLTGCSNRNSFSRALKQSISRARRKNEQLAVLFFDLNKFKDVNDLYGHSFGDKLLMAVAERVRRNIREEDHLARYGGDEFAVLLDDIRGEEHAESTARKIYDAFTEHFVIDAQEIFITPSIGISIFPQDGTDPDKLIKAADIAMYEAKDSDVRKYFRYSHSMELKLTETIRAQQALQNALHNHEFSLRYQLYFDCRSGRATGAEALLRWQNLNFRSVATEAFITILEESGLIVPVGNWVLTEACQTVKDWEDMKILPDDFRMSINLSMRQLKEPGFVAGFNDIIQRVGVRPQRLQLEITESIVMEDPFESMSICSELNDLGVTVAIDDFGTGYSSLAYLARLHMGVLKIDRFFINQSDSDDSARTIVTATINLAHNLHCKVIAEGVETPEQLAWLETERCDSAQGYHLAMPEDRELVKTRLLKESKGPR